jgi:aldose 1-epimerase
MPMLDMKHIALSVILKGTLILCACSDNPSTDAHSDEASKNAPLASLPKAEAFDTVLYSKKIALFYLRNQNGIQAAVTNYGARMVGMLVPDKNDRFTDVVIGFNNIADFIKAEERFFGAIVGRYGNRIAKGQFELDGRKYKLDLNNGPNTLHGGRSGFHSRVWDVVQPDSSSLVLTYVSFDGEEGYPGTVKTQVTYRITKENELHMLYETTTDARTVINITNHNFWNLNGEGSGTIGGHELMVKASKYTPIDSTFIPTGIEPVAGTPFDFTTFHQIGERVNAENIQLKFASGYDHNFVLDKGITPTPEFIATVKGDLSGIEMDILTTEPGLQFYGGNFMQSKHTLKSGFKDDFRTAFCLETQHFPDSPNQPSFPSTVIEPGIMYKSVTVYKFNTPK